MNLTKHGTLQMKISALIIDDEPKSVKLVESILRRSCNDVEILATSKSPEDAISLINRYNPDLVITDIDMPGINGLELVSSFNDRSFAVIYITGYDQFAIQAVRTNAVDYLLKPVTEKALVFAVSNAIKRI